jgi:hypothetical protein
MLSQKPNRDELPTVLVNDEIDPYGSRAVHVREGLADVLLRLTRVSKQ